MPFCTLFDLASRVDETPARGTRGDMKPKCKATPACHAQQNLSRALDSAVKARVVELGQESCQDQLPPAHFSFNLQLFFFPNRQPYTKSFFAIPFQVNQKKELVWWPHSCIPRVSSPHGIFLRGKERSAGAAPLFPHSLPFAIEKRQDVWLQRLGPPSPCPKLAGTQEKHPNSTMARTFELGQKNREANIGATRFCR